MIDPIAGWTISQRASGIFVVPPDGQDAGAVRYHERVRPLRRMSDIVSAQPNPPGWVETSRTGIEPLTTVEGEHAALVTLCGTLDGVPIERTIGAVFGDDFYSLAIGLARRPDQFARFRAAVRQMVIEDTHMLGVRRRRFRHAPPPGWHGLSAGLAHTVYLPPHAPRDATSLIVYPALPVPPGDGSFVEDLVDAHVAALMTTRIPVAAGGLTGEWWAVTAAEAAVALDVVVLQDLRYAYTIALQSPSAQHAANLPVLQAVLASVQPVPTGSSAQQAAVMPALCFDMWGE
jgi:hypothetical protein